MDAGAGGCNTSATLSGVVAGAAVGPDVGGRADLIDLIHAPF